MNRIDKGFAKMSIFEILAVLCLVVFLVLVFAASTKHKDTGSGDVNQDGILTQEDLDLAADFVICRKCPTIKQLQEADVNGDGRMTSSDLTLMCRVVDGGTSN